MGRLIHRRKHSSVGIESPCNAGNPSLIPGSGRSAGEGIGYPLQYSWASLLAQLVRIHLQCGRPGFYPWVGKIPWRREWLPTPVFLPREFHGLYSSWGRKESDMTEQLSLLQKRDCFNVSGTSGLQSCSWGFVCLFSEQYVYPCGTRLLLLTEGGAQKWRYPMRVLKGPTRTLFLL